MLAHICPILFIPFERPLTLITVFNIVYFRLNKRLLDDVVVDPLLLSLLETIFESDHFLLSSTVGINIGTEEEAQVPHRDDGKYPIARPHQELVMNMIIAVDEFTEANGGTVLFEGSHKWLYEGENNYATKNVLAICINKILNA